MQVDSISNSAGNGPTAFPFGLNSPVAPSRIILDTGNGVGSINTTVRRYVNVRENFGGADLTYSDSASLGGSITVNTTGLYFLMLTDTQDTTQTGFMITKNSLVTDSSNPNASIVMASADSTATLFVSGSGVRFLTAGDVLRVTTNAPTGNSTRAQVQFAVQKIF